MASQCHCETDAGVHVHGGKDAKVGHHVVLILIVNQGIRRILVLWIVLCFHMPFPRLYGFRV